MIMDALSTMTDDASSQLNQRIAERVRDLRAANGLSLDALAGRSGVSRSMISLIERGESSPTAVVLEKLAAGLGVTLASLFDAPRPSRRPGGAARRPAASGATRPRATVRRNVSPRGFASPMQIVEVSVPARRARGLRDRRARAAAAPAGVGARRRDRRHASATRATGSRRRLPGHASSTARTMFHNPTRKTRALRRGDRAPKPAPGDDMTLRTIRRLSQTAAARRDRRAGAGC